MAIIYGSQYKYKAPVLIFFAFNNVTKKKLNVFNAILLCFTLELLHLNIILEV